MSGGGKHVVVLSGGWSAEREVSLVSGRGVAEALTGCGYSVRVVDPPRDLVGIAQALTPVPDVVFNALHGTGGEDGTIQAILDLLGIPYTHSGVLASAVAMDKVFAKRVVAAAGVPVAGGIVVTPVVLAEGHPIPPPYVVKPVSEGSSVGIVIVRSDNERAENPGWTEDAPLLVEPYIRGRELTVGVMSRPGDSSRALGVTEIVFPAGFFDFTAKYTIGGATHILGPKIRESVYRASMDYARLAHDAIGCTGVSRSDFRWDDSRPDADGLIFLEINTQPGMTPVSLVPEQAAAIGMSYAELVSWMVEGATCRH